MITVETTEAGLRVTIPTDEVPPQRLNVFLDWLRLEAIAARSRLTEADADRLAEESKADWWAVNKSRFIPPGQ
ncbi:MAG: hypothetical protein HYY24_13125 [Verrucomicrobia bacterium]|nr:hypothetical protein [Verrucomicrobiota bacterium]